MTHVVIASEAAAEFEAAADWYESKVRRFPFVLFFNDVDEGTVVVLAIAHMHRRSGYSLKREGLPDFE
ncbi:MAG: hypothetical protein ACI9KE_002291 [Polyangiales bacterium]|jgi:hypothetical protein